MKRHLEDLSVHKLMLMGITASFVFALLLYNIEQTADTVMKEDIESLEKKVDGVASDVSYIKGKIDAYWPEETNNSTP